MSKKNKRKTAQSPAGKSAPAAKQMSKNEHDKQDNHPAAASSAPLPQPGKGEQGKQVGAAAPSSAPAPQPSKSEQRKQRDAKRKQSEQRKKLLTTAATIGGVVLLVVIIALSGGGAAPPVAQARLDLDPVMGSADAPVTLIEYGAYACPACKAWHQQGIVEDILAEFPGQVRFIFRDLPIISPSYDRMAAELAQCTLDQSLDVFWTFHDLLYTEAQQGFSRFETLLSLASRSGAEEASLQSCYEAGTHRQTVAYDFQRAQSLGLNGTPSWFVNEQRIFNASPQVLRDTILRELARLGG